MAKMWGKTAVIVLFSVFLWLVGKQAAPEISAQAASGSSSAVELTPSIFAETEIFVPLILAYALLVYGLLAIIFIYLQPGLPQKRWRKGLWYGVAFGGLWFIGMLEGSLVLGTPLVQELFIGISDALPMVVLGLLLGRFVATDSSLSMRQGRGDLRVIPVVALAYLIGRYLAYALLQIDSAYLTMPLGTLVWTLGVGLWVGLMYWLLQPGLRGETAVAQASFFAIIVFGSNWFLFTFFLPLLFEMNLLDLLARAAVDIASVWSGVLIAHRWNPQ